MSEKGKPKSLLLPISAMIYMAVNTICQVWVTKTLDLWSHDEFFHISHAVQFY